MPWGVNTERVGTALAERKGGRSGRPGSRTLERRPDLYARWLEQELAPAHLQQSQP